jgi:hypothetical protein
MLEVADHWSRLWPSRKTKFNHLQERTMNVIKLTDLDVSGKRVFIRADLNVPQDEAGNITEDTRIRASLPSIKYCLEKGAAVMVTSHLGRPTEGELTPRRQPDAGRRAPRPDAAHIRCA